MGTYASQEHAAEVGSVPWGVEALVGAVLAHWAHPDAVLEFYAADLERGEELGDGLVVWLGVDGCARGWLLRRGPVGDALCAVIVDVWFLRCLLSIGTFAVLECCCIGGRVVGTGSVDAGEYGGHCFV